MAGLTEAGYSVVKPGGAFYVFPEVPQSTGESQWHTGKCKRVRGPGD